MLNHQDEAFQKLGIHRILQSASRAGPDRHSRGQIPVGRKLLCDPALIRSHEKYHLNITDRGFEFC
jgi:hypothetical protein